MTPKSKSLALAIRTVIERLESRRLLSSTLVSGPASITAGAPYQLNLNVPPQGSGTTWNVNWGDGTNASPISGNTLSATHQYATGVTSAGITATLSSMPKPLDTSFGTSGKVVTDMGSAADHAYDVAIVPDTDAGNAGKIVVAGGAGFSIARYNPDGSLDASFGSGGKAAISSSGASFGMAIQSDGKYLVGGGDNFAMARFNADGSLDTTFGSGGIASSGFGSTYQSYDLALLPNGKIVQAGRNGNDMVIARFNANGSVDTTFGSGGRRITDFAGSIDKGFGLAVDGGGRLVMVGQERNGATNFDWAITRYTADGTLDSSFGNGGKITTSFGSDDELAWTVDIQPDGKIVAGGRTRAANDYDFAVARYNTDGSLDSSFGSGGKQTTDFGTGGDQVYAIKVLADGRIAAVGWAQSSNAMDFGVAIYQPNGQLDTTFGAGGKYRQDFNGSTDDGEAVAVQADGDLVIAGSASTTNSNGASDFAVTRLHMGNTGFLNVGGGLNGGTYQSSFRFGPDNSAAVPGYITDIGEQYHNGSSGYTYGWVNQATGAKAQNSGNIRGSINAAPALKNSAIVTVKDGVPLAWEAVVPNGSYYVKLVAGDPTAPSGTYKYGVEGANNFLSGTAQFVTATGVVNVTDGKLTIYNGGAPDHALSYVEITDAGARARNVVIAPSDVAATAAGSTAVDVRWRDTSDNETGFRVDRATDPSGTWTQVGTTYANAGVFTDTTATANTTYSYRVVAVKGSAVSRTVSNLVTMPATGVGQTPYNTSRTPWTVDTTIQAEDFDAGGDGVSYDNDLIAGNAGGYYRRGDTDVGYNIPNSRNFVGWTRVGEWIEYTVSVPTAGTYQLQASVASQGQGGTFAVSTNGVNQNASITIPDTTAFTAYQQVGSASFTLPAGNTVIRLKAVDDGVSSYYLGDMDWLRLSRIDTQPVGSLSGYVWNDINANRILDGDFIQSDTPHFVYIADVSGSVNGFNATTRNALKDLNRRLIEAGFGETARISMITSYGTSVFDLNPFEPGLQAYIPAGELDPSGDRTLLDERLDGITPTGGTYEDLVDHDYYTPATAMLRAREALIAGGVGFGDPNIIFLGDGQNRDNAELGAIGREIKAAYGGNVRAFGIADYILPELRKIDQAAVGLDTADDLAAIFSGLIADDATVEEDKIAGWTVYLDTNNNGVLDQGEQSRITGTNGAYAFNNVPVGTYNVRIVSQADWTGSVPDDGLYPVEVQAGVSSDGLNFGEYKSPAGLFFNAGPVNEGSQVTVRFTQVQGKAPFTYSFDFNNDGDFTDEYDTNGNGTYEPGIDYADVSGSISPQVTDVFTDDGQHVVRGRITDDDGRTRDFYTTVDVKNAPPTVDVHGPEIEPRTGSPLTLTSDVYDPSSVDQLAPFAYTWAISLNGNAFALPTTVNVHNSSLTFTPTEAGIYTAVLTATDKDGGTGTSSPYVFDVGPANVPPVVSTPFADQSPVTGTMVQLGVIATDNDGPASLTYLWECVSKPDGAPAPVLDDPTNLYPVVTFGEAGEYQFRVAVSDGTPPVVSDPLTLTVEATPSAIQVSPHDVDLVAGQTQQFTASVTDQFGDTISDAEIAWAAASGPDNIDQNGSYTAPADAQSDEVAANCGTVQDIAEITVQSVVTPTVTITATQPSASEASSVNGQFTVTRSIVTDQPLVVNYVLDTANSTATEGDDFVALSGTVTIRAGQASAAIDLVPVDDAIVESNESVILTLAPPGNSGTYTIGTVDRATIYITDDDAPVATGETLAVWVEASDSSVTLFWDTELGTVYRVYRGTTPDFALTPQSLITTTSIGITEDAVSTSGVTLFYRIVAEQEGVFDSSRSATITNGVDQQFILPDMEELSGRQNRTSLAAASPIKHKIDWLQDAFTRAGIDPKKWTASFGYVNTNAHPNQNYTRAVYNYYQQLNQRNRGLLWTGMARIAGGPVVRGLQTAASATTLAAYLSTGMTNGYKQAAARWAAAKSHYVEGILIFMQQSIFLDLAWQHEAYLGGGINEIYELNSAGEMPQGTAVAWQNIDIGINGGSLYALEVGNTAILRREQEVILKRGYDTLRSISGVAGVMSNLVENPYKSPLTNGQPFDASTGLITDLLPRWQWISTEMTAKWYGLPQAVRDYWVDEPYAHLIAGF